jgi:prepilin-type N-terminal cleavage/methylation domain-containing protein
MRIDKKGFTLIELIVVLAITAIIGAILVPNFIGTVDTTRLRSDIISVSVMQNALDIYVAEGGQVGNDTANSIVDMLVEQRYISSGRIQTEGGEWAFNQNNQIVIDISNTSAAIHEIARDLSYYDRAKLIGIRGE